MSEAPTEDLEHAEHAQHAVHSGDPILARVSVTIAILAVLAATVGSFETVESGSALGDKSESVLLQNRASDGWAYFQSQSIKKNIYDIAASEATDADRKAAFDHKARDYEAQSNESRAKAEDLEKDRDAKLADSGAHERRHHVLTVAVTLLHVSIAVTTIAIIMRGRRWPWYGGMAMGAIGTLLAASAYV